MESKRIKPNLTALPAEPGVYLYRNVAGEIIYIGKAKNLKNRVRSYWTTAADLSPAKQQMIRSVRSVDYIVVNNEREAVLLEAGLIKKHQPAYNVVLRDDKNWLYIVITDEAVPRVITIRGGHRVKGEYFGPFTNAKVAKTILRLLYKIFPLRSTKKSYSKLPRELNYWGTLLTGSNEHTNTSPSPADYREIIDHARRVLKGETADLLIRLHTEMRKSSERREYERAAVFRNKIQALERIVEPQDVVHPLFSDQDIIGIAEAGNTAVVALMQLRGGQLLDTVHYTMTNALGLPPHEVAEKFVLQYYSPTQVKPREVVMPVTLSPGAVAAVAPMRVVRAQRGTKKRLIRLAEKNAWTYAEKTLAGKARQRPLYELKRALDLPRLPVRIEVYDISNIHGKFAVGAMVVAVDSVAAPSGYRNFKIRTVAGSNDVAMLQEVIRRREKHPEWPDPDLIVLDGGKPQLNAVRRTIRADWRDRVVALAKKQEEIFVPGRRLGIRLKRSDPGLQLLQRMRDEAHRRAITYYRKRHSREQR